VRRRMIKNTASGWGHACKVKGRGAHMSIPTACWHVSLNLLVLGRPVAFDIGLVAALGTNLWRACAHK